MIRTTGLFRVVKKEFTCLCGSSAAFDGSLTLHFRQAGVQILALLLSSSIFETNFSSEPYFSHLNNVNEFPGQGLKIKYANEYNGI